MTKNTLLGQMADPYEQRGAQMQPQLDDESIAAVERYGEKRHVETGEVLFNPGDQQISFTLVLSGRLAIETDGCEGVHVVVEHQRGNFSGEIDMFSNRRALARGRCTEAGEMVFLDRAAFKRFLGSHSELSEIIIRAFVLRRMGLIYRERGDLTLIGDPQSALLLALRSFLARNGHPHQFVDVAADEAGMASALSDHFNLKPSDLPAAIYRYKDVLPRPTARQLADLVGLSQPSGDRDIYDVGVVGVGPAGLAVAVNAAAEGMSVVALESLAPGGQAGTSSKIENYPAFPTGISGQALSGRMMLQAQKFGTEILTPRTVNKLDCDSYPYTLHMDDGESVKVKSVVVATGAHWRRLGLEKEDVFENAGIYYGATPMEASQCENEEVVVVGGGNSAGQAAVFLARRTQHVHLLIRRTGLESTMSDYLIKRIDADDRITLHTETEVDELRGDEHLTGMTWLNRATGEREKRNISHLFVMIGAVPNARWLEGCVMTDDKGFIITGSDLPTNHLVTPTWHVNRMPHIGETSQPGVFAVGDVRSGSVKRVASAVGEGAISAQFLYKVVNPSNS